jgi:hypothetical protein
MIERILYMTTVILLLSTSNIYGNTNYLVFNDSSILLEKEGFKFLFYEDTGETIFSFNGNNCKIEDSFGRIVGRFGMPPQVETRGLDSLNMGIFLTIRFYDFGVAVDAVICYAFNVESCTLIKLCSFPDVGIYKLNSDTLSEALSYKYIVNNNENKIVLEEYYKGSIKSKMQEQIIRRREFYYNLCVEP